MKIESEAFIHKQPIPPKYTCDGQNVSPPLKFDDIPEKAKSLALIVDDPDAPKGLFTHWVVWNLPPNLKVLSEGMRVPRQGKNTYGVALYKGPCPPPGPVHRYFFKLYALDQMIGIPEGSTKAQLEAAMEGHVLETAELIGTYQK